MDFFLLFGPPLDAVIATVLLSLCLLRFAARSLAIGSPIGADGAAVFGRYGFALSPGFSLAMDSLIHDVFAWKKGASSTMILTWLVLAQIGEVSSGPADGGFWDWLNRNEGAASIVLSTVIVAITLALSAFNFRADRIAGKMYRSTEATRKNSMLPVLVVSLGEGDIEHTGTSSIKFPIEIQNSGNGPALNPEFNWSTSSQSVLGRGPAITAIAAGSSIRTSIAHPDVVMDILESEPYYTLDTPVNDRPKAPPTKSGTLEVGYFDVSGREHKTKVEIVFETKGGFRPIFGVSSFTLDTD